MARAKPETTKYPGIYKRVISTRGGASKGRIVYDIKIKNDWPSRGEFTNLEDARRERERLLGQVAQGISIKRGTTVAKYVEDVWLPHQEAKIVQGKLRETTLAEYRSALRAHIVPAFGDKRLGDVTPLHVERFFDDLIRAGLAPFTLLNIRKPLNGVFDHATKKRLLPFNPVAAVEPPKQTRRREPHPLTVDDVWRLANAAPTDDDRNLILAAAFTGLRASELFGLRWANVYLEPGAEYLVVVEQFYQGTHVNGAKSRSGNRRVTLNDDAAAVLRAQLPSDRTQNGGLVFASVRGAHVRASNWNRRVWQPTRESAGLPGLHFHDLRAFYVSVIRAAALDPAWTKQLVGHADDRTHDLYTHTIPGSEPVTRAKLAGRFAQPRPRQVSST